LGEAGQIKPLIRISGKEFVMASSSEQLREALGKVSSEDLKEVAQGVATAAQIESEGISFYGRQAKKFEGSDTGHFFKFLQGQEEEHLKAIGELKQALEEKGQWIEPQLSKPEVKMFSKKDWDKENSEGITAILFAMWKEKQAREFYEGIASRIKNEGAKRFFLALAEFEKGHAEMLEEFVEDSYYTHELIMG
jgi:rubrerythrin